MQPHAARIGQLVIAWNELHETLSKLFELVVDSPHRKMGVSIWHSTDNDFAQRKMLRAAIGRSKKLKPPQSEDIIWVLNRIDDTLRHNGNDVVHSPYLHIYGLAKASKLHVMPDVHSESPRAKSLFNKMVADGLAEHIEEATQLADRLGDFANNMFRTILNPTERSWQQRPKLPRAHRKASPKGSSCQSSAK
jgi:hypothetical protein